MIGTLVQAHGAQHDPVAPADPIEAITLHVDQGGLSVADMVPCIGPRHRVDEAPNGKRPLTMHMIRRLLTLGIPAPPLVGQPGPPAAWR